MLAPRKKRAWKTIVSLWDSKEIPTDPGNIPQTLNHLFMKEILSYFITFVFWGTFQGSVEIFLEGWPIFRCELLVSGRVCPVMFFFQFDEVANVRCVS